jgi:L-fuculose-phosphate aldolase
MTGPGLDAWRESLIEVGSDLYAHGLVSSHGGNLSVRRPAGGALITASGAMLGRLTGAQLVAVDATGVTVQQGALTPSSNTAIHLAIYAAHPRAGAVLHAHPPYAVARSLALEGGALHPINYEGRLVLGTVPVLTVTDSEAPRVVAEALGSAPVVIVRGHGTFAVGDSVWQALRYTSALEEAAQVLTHARDGLSSEGVPLRRATLLTLEGDAYARWQAVVARTAPAAVRADGWTLKDVVAHVAAWHRFAVRHLGQVERGETGEPVDVDAINTLVRAQTVALSWEAVLAEAESAHQAFVAALQAVPASVLEAEDGFGAFVITINGLGHYAEHLRDFDGLPH